MGWRPGAYKAERALQMPHADVPEFLRTELIEWVTNRVSTDNERMRAVLLYLQIPQPRDRPITALQKEWYSNSWSLLRSVEYILEMWPDFGAADRLEDLLARTPSAYAVRPDRLGLTMRVDPSVAAQVRQVVEKVESTASEHLTDAWNAAYGRTSDPVKAYDEAIRAVEAAFRPIVTPQNDKQTLTSMVADIRQAPQKWTFILPNGEFSDGVADGARHAASTARRAEAAARWRSVRCRPTPKRRLGPQSTSP